MNARRWWRITELGHGALFKYQPGGGVLLCKCGPTRAYDLLTRTEREVSPEARLILFGASPSGLKPADVPGASFFTPQGIVCPECGRDNVVDVRVFGRPFSEDPRALEEGRRVMVKAKANRSGTIKHADGTICRVANAEPVLEQVAGALPKDATAAFAKAIDEALAKAGEK